MGNKQLIKKKTSRKRQLRRFQQTMEQTKRRKLDNFTAEDDTISLDYIELQNMEMESPISSKLKVSQNNDEATSSNILNPRIAQVDDTYRVPSLLEEEDTHELQISFDLEEELPDKTVGRRIVAISNFFTKLQSICNHGPLGCGIQEMQLVGEVKHGLTSKFLFRCQLCKKKFSIPSDDCGENYLGVNQCAVAGTIAIGCGHSQLQEMLSSLNLPLISDKTYAECHDNCSAHWERVLEESMHKAAEEEKQLALEEGRVKNGIPKIDVVADGCWSKRSYKKNYNASSGAASIIGRRTGKILYLGIKNKYCSTCAYAQRKETTTPEHACYKNFNGSSTSMESDIIVEGFKKSIEMHGLIYERLISDGDASTYAKILQARPYSDVTVEKVECRNHILRNFCNKLKNLTTETKYQKKLRGLISRNTILGTRAVICKAMAKHKINSDVQLLFEDILLSHHHGFGDHSKCRPYFCHKVGEVENRFKKLSSSALWQKICFLTQYVASHARSLIHDVDSNVVERYNSIIAKFVGGKRINFSKKSSYHTRCLAAAVSFNEKKSISLLYKSMNAGRSPQGTLKRLERERISKNMKRKKNAKAKLRLNTRVENKTTDKDYGPESLKPDIEPDVFESLKKNFLNDLNKTSEEREQIQQNTVLQAESGEWLELRRTLLTASNFGKVINRRPNTNCANFVKDLLYKVNIDHVPSIKHGKENETMALKQLEKEHNLSIRPCGLHIDAELPFLGATPDGLCGDDMIIEIKCPITAHRMGIDEAIKCKKVTFWKRTKKGEEVNKKHPWFYQIQGQLHITGRSKCLFAVWSGEKEKLKTEIIVRDDQFWSEKMELKLKDFYIRCILPELIDPRHPRGLPIRNPIQNEDKENHKPDDKIGQDMASPSICLSIPTFSNPVDNLQPVCSKYLNFDSY
ncbi:uncharacterized protein LOC134672945 isoform X1 [Cydia fagiglandana]|uniref:uncharacterized protein LOC134672945 isoform X1 n=1 Tax=Cydia fagiglandana TaxID=1458189 RepID=UPI002FEDF9A0